MWRGGGALYGAGMHAGLRGVHTCVRGCAHVCRAVQTRRGVHTCRDTPRVPVHVPADPRVPIRGPHPRCCSCCKGQTGKGEFALPSSGPPQPGAAPPFPRPPGGTGGAGAGTGDLGSRRPCAAPGAGQGRAALPVPPPARSRTDSTGSTGALLRSPPPLPSPAAGRHRTGARSHGKCGTSRYRHRVRGRSVGPGLGGVRAVSPCAALLPASRSPGAPAAVPRTATLHRTGTSPGAGGGRGCTALGSAPSPQPRTDPPRALSAVGGPDPRGEYGARGDRSPRGGGRGRSAGLCPGKGMRVSRGGGRAAAHSRAISSVSRCAINNSRDPSRSACHEIFIPAVTERVKRSSALHSLGVPAGHSALTPQRCQNGRWAHCDWGRGGCGGSCRWGPALVGMGGQM